MKAQILVIGDELLAGKIQDANTQVIAKWLIKEGFELSRVVITSDERESLMKALKEAWDNSDLVLTTGGLGPTEDDITKVVIGDFFGGTLKDHPVARSLATLHYKRIDKDWSPQTNSYHLIPEGLEPVANPAGLAPGLSCAREGKLLVSAPGVPRELKAMLEDPFRKLLDQHFPKRQNDLQVLTIRTVGVPEERIFFELMPNLWKELSEHGKVSSLPQVVGVDIHISFKGDKKALEEKREFWKSRLKDTPLAPHIWSYELKSIEEVVLEMAREKNIKIGLAESCTGGLVANRLTNIPGSSSHFYGGIVAYHNEVKVNILGVKEETLKAHGAVSHETATEMAAGVLNALKVDVAISLTGIAGPDGGSEEKPVGTVCIGEGNREGAKAKIYHFRGNREYLKLRFSEMGLHRLRRIIEDL